MQGRQDFHQLGYGTGDVMGQAVFVLVKENKQQKGSEARGTERTPLLRVSSHKGELLAGIDTGAPSQSTKELRIRGTNECTPRNRPSGAFPAGQEITGESCQLLNRRYH